MDAQVTFIGKLIPSGKSVTIAADFDDDELETIHFTQVALGPKPAKGPHTIFIENGDGKFAVGTLDRENCTQFSMDITIACDDVTISHTGESEVHLTGYRTVAIVGLGEVDDEFGNGEEDGLRLYRKAPRGSFDEEDDDEDEESSDDEEPPRAVPLEKKERNNQLIQDEASEGSSSDEEEEEEAEDDSSEEEEEDSEADEEMEEGSEEEEEEAPPAKSAKRKQAAAAAQTPQPAKKAKAADVAKAPATAPAKVITSNGESPAGDHTEFAAELKSFLQKNGPCKLSVLGSSVKRPPRSPKFKKIIEQNSDIFSFNPVTETVSLNLK
ncbi:hypothetical protein Ndes2526B_g05758 [Nannochloris sp. 'desiccata']|nr:hypothetical protein KSW81_007583 [Chlorella desiccata (nom. nud.)]